MAKLNFIDIQKSHKKLPRNRKIFKLLLKFNFGAKMAEEEHNKEKEEDNVYDEDSREDLVEDGEISPEEAGFMKGYDEADEENEEKKEEEE